MSQPTEHRHRPTFTLDCEEPSNIQAIREVIKSAFASKSHLGHKEADIVDALREAGALRVSLIAYTPSGEIVGHIASSPVLMDGEDWSWQGLGPVSVKTEWQGMGVGSLLVKGALAMLSEGGFGGCVVCGQPGFYERFGFQRHDDMVFEGAPARFFLVRGLLDPVQKGVVTYHEAFNVGGV